jgi:hypothetical protein
MGRTKNTETKIDWNNAFIFYCTPNKETGRLPTYLKVSEHYGINERHVEKMGSKHDWVERRDEVGKMTVDAWQGEREKLIKKTEQEQFATWNEAVRVMQRQVKQLFKRQDQNEAVEEILDELFDELTTAKNDKERSEIKKKIGNVMNRKIYAKELRESMEALKTSMNGLRITLGMPTEISKADVTNFNKEIPLSDEDLEKMDQDFEKANENKQLN